MRSIYTFHLLRLLQHAGGALASSQTRETTYIYMPFISMPLGIFALSVRASSKE